MLYLTSRTLGAVVSGLLFVSVAHAQATINDCEKIQAADAYNQCLAKFGPTSKVQNLAPERPSDMKGSSAEAAASAGKRASGGAHAGGRRRGHVRKASGGRKRMTIAVGHRHR